MQKASEEFRRQVEKYKEKGYKLTSLQVDLSCGHTVELEPELLDKLDSDEFVCPFCGAK